MYDFEYATPTTVDEVVSILAENGDDARILAGGTDIIAQLKENRRVKVLVDVKKIPEAKTLSYDPGNGLDVGAAVPCCETYETENIAAAYPGLMDATTLIGSIQIQNRATMTGNLCNSSPAADTIPVMIALGGVARIVGPNGEREVAVEAFCTGPGQNVLQNGEFVLSIHFPAPAPNSGGFFLRFIPRNEMDIAVANAGAYVVLNDAKTHFESGRLAVGAVAPTPLFIEEAGTLLAGQEVSDEIIEEAADLAKKQANPITDMRGTVEQRIHLSGVLSKRALHGAVQRAKES